MKAILLPQKRTVELPGRRRVADVLAHLAITPGTVMVIHDDQLLTDDQVIGPDDEIEIRSVISGGAPVGPAEPGRR